jgi:hypothetical protein
MREGATLRLLVVLSLLWVVDGCAAGRVKPVGGFPSTDPPLKTIALAPNGGIFADVIGIELAGQGYTIFDTGATLALLMLMQKTQNDLFSPEVIARFKEHGIEAVLVVQKTDGNDGLPQTAQIRLHRTESVTDVGGIDWKNSWIRRGTLESAQEIAAAMSQEVLAADSAPGQR